MSWTTDVSGVIYKRLSPSPEIFTNAYTCTYSKLLCEYKSIEIPRPPQTTPMIT